MPDCDKCAKQDGCNVGGSELTMGKCKEFSDKTKVTISNIDFYIGRVGELEQQVKELKELLTIKNFAIGTLMGAKEKLQEHKTKLNAEIMEIWGCLFEVTDACCDPHEQIKWKIKELQAKNQEMKKELHGVFETIIDLSKY